MVGRYRNRLLTYNGQEHQLVVGASRSGKGVGHVIPTLLTWQGSALVYDIKGELWEATAGFRSRFSHCISFNPTHPQSARFNPLLEIRKGPNEIRDTQNIVEMLVNPDGSKEQLDVWDQHASQLLVAPTLHVLYTEPDHRKHLGVVRERLLNWPSTFRDMIELPHRLNPNTGAPEPHPEVARVASELMRQAPRFAAGVRATALGHLALYADEIVCRNVAVSDCMAGDLVCAEHPVTLYLQPPPSDFPRLRPLMRVLLNQICRALLERLDADNRGRPKRLRRHWFARRKDIITLLKESITKTESELTDTDALNKAQELAEALQALGGDCCSFGHFTLTITTWDEDEHAAEKDAQAIQRVCDGVGLVSRIEDFNAVQAWLGSLPGHAYADVRRPILSSLSLCDLIPLSSVWSGAAWNDHLAGPPLAVVNTTGSTPFRLNFHQADVGHALLVGPPGRASAH